MGIFPNYREYRKQAPRHQTNSITAFLPYYLVPNLVLYILFLVMERETGFEPATPSLEGLRSSQLSYSRITTVLGIACVY